MPTQTFLNLDKEKRNRIIDAAINLFAERTYEQTMISDIIKIAKIPRGSFYQYFEDKDDLYFYIFDIVKLKKMEYMKNTLTNYENISFINLVRKLYNEGVKFATDHPKYIKIIDNLLRNKNYIYDKLIKNNISIAENIYVDLIKKDMEKGLIRKDIDAITFAKIIVQLTSNIAVEELDLDNLELSYNKMIDKNSKILDIIEYGVSERIN